MDAAANDMFGLQHGFSHNFDKNTVGGSGGLNFSHLAATLHAPNAPNMPNPLNHPQLSQHAPHGLGSYNTSQQMNPFLTPHHLTAPGPPSGGGVFNSSVNPSPFLNSAVGGPQPGVGAVHVHPQSITPSSPSISSSGVGVVGGLSSKNNPQGPSPQSNQVSMNHESSVAAAAAAADFSAVVPTTVTSINSSMRGGPNVDLPAPIAANPSIPNLYSQSNVCRVLLILLVWL